MSIAADDITVSVPRQTLARIVRLSDDLLDRMHALLERNTDGDLTAAEREELATLTHMAQFGQIVSMAMGGAKP